MSTITLKRIRLKNFQGVVEANHIINGNILVRGRNASQKTTRFYRSLLWLLTGKDEQDRQDYDIKNTKLPDLNKMGHEVEATFDKDGEEIVLKRVYLEDWVKAHGNPVPYLKGHYTDYFINGVKQKTKTLYDEYVATMIPLNLVRLLMNPAYFNNLDWEARRRGLIGIAGIVTPDDVFANIEKTGVSFSAIKQALLQKKTPETFRSELNAKKLVLKKEGAEFGPRIDEVMQGKPEPLEWEKISESIFDKVRQVDDINKALSDASKEFTEKQKAVVEKQRLLHSKRTALDAERVKLHKELSDAQEGENPKIAEIKRELVANVLSQRSLKSQIESMDASKVMYEKEILAKDAQVVVIRGEYNELLAEKFDPGDDATKCGACKQALPEDKAEGILQTLRNNFNDDLLARKTAKMNKADALKKQILVAKDALAEIAQSGLSKQLDDLVIRHEKLTVALAMYVKQESEKAPVDINEQVAEQISALPLSDEIISLKAEIDADNAALGKPEDNTAKRAEITQLATEIDALKQKLLTKTTIEKADLRIAELTKQQAINAQAIADLENQEYEIETYTRAYMDIVEKRVNNLFVYVSFRMFTKQVNGEIKEDCVCLYDGVRYESMNTGAKMIAGLDCINAFQRFYNIYPPVIADNTESAHFLPPTQCQVISIFADANENEISITNL